MYNVLYFQTCIWRRYMEKIAMLLFFFRGVEATNKIVICCSLVRVQLLSTKLGGNLACSLDKRIPILHPRKLTCLLKRDYFNRKYIFQPLIFRGHVSFPGSRYFNVSAPMKLFCPTFTHNSWERIQVA